MAKKIASHVLLGALACVFVISSAFVSARFSNPTVTSFLLHVDNVTPKNYSDVVTAIESSQSSIVLKYCASYQIFVVSYDTNDTSPDDIIRVLVNEFPKCSCLVKDPAGFDSDQAGCVSQHNVINNAQH